MDDLMDLTVSTVSDGALEEQFADHLEEAAAVFGSRHKYDETSDGECVVKVVLEVELRQTLDSGVTTTKTIVRSQLKKPKRKGVGRYCSFRDGRFKATREPEQMRLQTGGAETEGH